MKYPGAGARAFSPSLSDEDRPGAEPDASARLWKIMALPGSARPLQIPCLDGGLHALRPCSIALLVFGVLFQLAELLPIELAKRPLSPSIAYVGLRIVVFSLLIGLSDLNPRSVTRPVTGMAAMECCNAASWASSHGGSGPTATSLGLQAHPESLAGCEALTTRKGGRGRARRPRSKWHSSLSRSGQRCVSMGGRRKIRQLSLTLAQDLLDEPHRLLALKPRQ
jgi:hypothetical protein